MFFAFPKLFPSRITKTAVVFAGAAVFLALAAVTLRSQRIRTSVNSEAEDRPTFSDFKGVRIGMAAEEARKKLGTPRDKSDEQDFYVFNDSQAVQIFYDKGKEVSAISIDFMTGANGIPLCKDVLGAEAESKPDGSVYKLIRYPKAGYWVSYSRTAGNSPTVTITMQKIAH